jgi:hypothetical protein
MIIKKKNQNNAANDQENLLTYTVFEPNLIIIESYRIFFFIIFLRK